MNLLYKETRSHGRGSPEDESESWTDEVSFVLVPYEEREEYEERCADEYGEQDYSYRFDRKLLCQLDDNDITALKKTLEVK